MTKSLPKLFEVEDASAVEKVVCPGVMEMLWPVLFDEGLPCLDQMLW